MGTYEPPLSEIGAAITPGHEPLLAPGVRGYAVRVGDLIYIPLVVSERFTTTSLRAQATRKGPHRPIFSAGNAGDVGRFIDSLSPRCVFANVISPKLAKMLRRRGWKPRLEIDDTEGRAGEVWFHPHANRL